jgi:hypothetical protein
MWGLDRAAHSKNVGTISATCGNAAISQMSDHAASVIANATRRCTRDLEMKQASHAGARNASAAGLTTARRLAPSSGSGLTSDDTEREVHAARLPVRMKRRDI